MSVKLPFIVKREPGFSTPVKHSKEMSPPREQVEPPRCDFQDNPNEEYEDHDFQQIQEQEVESAPQPADTITVLKSQKLEPTPSALQQSRGQQYRKPQPDLKFLQEQLEHKLQTVGQLRSNIAEKKKQIKSIADQIDKDLNKSLLKASKQKTVNIRDIFSATPSKTSNLRLNTLNEELKTIRLTLKKVKQEIQKLQDGQADPVVLMNQQRGLEFKTRIRSAQQDIKTIEHEKSLLEEEIERGSKDIDEEEEKQKAQDIQKLSQQLAELHNSLKEEKLQLYRIEKEDIYLMEKTKYFREREGHIGVRRQKPSQRPKDQIQQQIKQLISQINATIEERNKTQSDKKLQAKQLASELTSLQTKNWDLCSKLREIDAFLLQYYEKKTRKKEAKHIEKTIDVMENSIIAKTQSHGYISESINKSKVSANDKNFQSVEVQVEKKKVYQFGVRQSISGQINLSDEFLGPKISLRSISLQCGECRIYRILAHYKNQKEAEITGMMMGSKNLPEGVSSLELKLEGDEAINFIHTGYDHDNAITFIHFVTSEGKQLKWGSLEQLVKSQQKHIKKYETSLIKAKLIQQITDSKQPLKLFLAGFALATTYNAPK